MSYNGWANRQTWAVNLELLDGFDASDFLKGYDLPDEEQEQTATEDLAGFFEDYVWEMVCDQSRGWSKGIVQDYLAQVDWEEIASHHVTDYVTELVYNQLKEAGV